MESLRFVRAKILFTQYSFIFFICCIVLGGFFVRFILALNRPFFGDDCGTMKYICQPWTYILSHFDLWLTMNFFILAEKAIASVFGEGFVAMRSMAILAGSGTIVLGAWLALLLFNRKNIAFVTAMLIAANPYLINHSANARAYATFAFFSLLGWIFFLRWRNNPTTLNAVFLSLTCLFLVLNHMNGLFLLPWFFLAVGMQPLRKSYERSQQMGFFRHMKKLFIILLLIISPGCFYYLLLAKKVITHNKMYEMPDRLLLSWVPELFNIYCGSFVSNIIVWLCFFFFLCGLWYVFERNHIDFLLTLLWLIVPAFLLVLSGYSLNPYDFARFIIFILPVILLVIAAGFDKVFSFFPARFQFILIALILGVIIVTWIPNTKELFAECHRFPMHKAFQYISEQKQPDDRIIGIEPYTKLHLSPYMSCNKRMEASETTWTSIWIVPELMKDTDKGNIFVVSILPGTPSFDTEPVVFGDIKISKLPPESSQNRYYRLFKGYNKAEQYIKYAGRKPEHFLFYLALADLAKLRGDDIMANYYSARAHE